MSPLLGSCLYSNQKKQIFVLDVQDVNQYPLALRTIHLCPKMINTLYLEMEHYTLAFNNFQGCRLHGHAEKTTTTNPGPEGIKLTNQIN